MNLENMHVATRIRLLVALALVGLVVLCTASLFNVRSSMIEDRKLQTKHLVETGSGVIDHFHKLAQAGTLSDADARKAAVETLRNMRYDKTNYLFVVDQRSHLY